MLANEAAINQNRCLNETCTITPVFNDVIFIDATKIEGRRCQGNFSHLSLAYNQYPYNSFVYSNPSNPSVFRIRIEFLLFCCVHCTRLGPMKYFLYFILTVTILISSAICEHSVRFRIGLQRVYYICYLSIHTNKFTDNKT